MHGCSLTDIAKRLCISTDELFSDFRDESTQVKMYYDSGRAKGKIETDKALYDLAKNGSSTAKKEYDSKMIDAQLANEFLEIFNA
jgi:hypothetical protein